MTFSPDYLCDNPICAAVLEEQLEARKRDADEIERLRAALSRIADFGTWTVERQEIARAALSVKDNEAREGGMAGIMSEEIRICKACNGSGWVHEACIGRFATGSNERPDGKCGSFCGADECAVQCDCVGRS